MADDGASRDALAAEYVLGTLPAGERAAFRRRMDDDPTLQAAVDAWDRRLAPLAATIAPVSPPDDLWDRIAAAAGLAGHADAPVPFESAAEIVRLRRSRAFWRGATFVTGAAALAAALLLAVLPEHGSQGASGLVAVVNRSGELPALIVRVDPRAGIVQVRAVAAETPANRSLELWSIVGGGAPHSLGVLTPGVTRAALPAADRAGLDGATLAVSVEPPGGSTTGGPTGPVVYSGKLVPEMP